MWIYVRSNNSRERPWNSSLNNRPQCEALGKTYNLRSLFLRALRVDIYCVTLNFNISKLVYLFRRPSQKSRIYERMENFHVTWDCSIFNVIPDWRRSFVFFNALIEASVRIPDIVYIAQTTLSLWFDLVSDLSTCILGTNQFRFCGSAPVLSFSHGICRSLIFEW